MKTKLTIAKIKNILKRYRPHFKYQDYVKSRDTEIHVAEQIERLSNNKFEIVFTGLGAGDAIKVEDWKYDPTRPLDLTVTIRKTSEELCRIEVQADYKYTFDKSKFFPIQEHKIMQAKQSNLPHYFVYILTLENTYYWLPTETIDQYGAVDLRTRLKGEIVIQRQHPVPKNVWNTGLPSLVKTLLNEPVETHKQETLA